MTQHKARQTEVDHSTSARFKELQRGMEEELQKRTAADQRLETSLKELGAGVESEVAARVGLAEEVDQAHLSCAQVYEASNPDFVREETEPQGRMSWEQLEGERLAQDPDWPQGSCWVASYLRMHNTLVRRAAEIQSEGNQARDESHANAGLEAPSIRSSLKLLKEEVFSLCPMHFLISGILVSFLLTTLSFLIPWVQGRLVDVAVDAAKRYAQEPQSVDIGAELFEPILFLSVLMFSSYFCEIIVGILFAICGHTTVTRLRIKLFRNLTEQEISFYDSHVSGELSSRLVNDSQALSSLTQFTTQTVLGAVVKFLGSLLAMFATHPKLALLATIITPINMLLVRRTGRTVGYYGVVQNHAMAKANAVAVEVLGSIRTVQSNVGERFEAEFFMERLNRYLRIIKATVYLETVLRFTQYGLSKVRNIVVLAVAMHQVITGELTIGGYTAFAQYVVLYEDGFKNLADIWINFKQTITATGKFIQLLLRRPDIPFDGGLRPIHCSGHLAIKGLSFAYAGRPDHQVLHSMRLEAKPGDVVALVGESGAGKTTLGRLLLRHYDPTAGSITLDGVDYRSLNIRWLRAQIGFVEQEPVLFDRSLCDNIAYGSAKGAPWKDIEDAAQRANAHNFISDLAKGYETHPGERAARISGGQKQRVAIARAIVRKPKVLVLDEATSALDSENESIVQQALDELMKGKTTFIIAHRLSTVVRSSKILVLEKGKVVEEGTHDELVANETSRSKVKNLVCEQGELAKQALDSARKQIQEQLDRERGAREVLQGKLQSSLEDQRLMALENGDKLEQQLRDLEQRFQEQLTLELRDMEAAQLRLSEETIRQLRDLRENFSESLAEERSSREAQNSSLEDHVDFLEGFFQDARDLFIQRGQRQRRGKIANSPRTRPLDALATDMLTPRRLADTRALQSIGGFE
ncbi:unnamed protein product [Effrenium voratum]|nr:unnamed protein product [Effrenium voratum]